MPSSDHRMIPKVLSVIETLAPRSILDVGVGNGRYGFLFRECLDWNWGRLKKEDWLVYLHGVEIDRTYITPVHDYVYNTIDICDWLYCEVERHFDLIFMGDILEHWPDYQWTNALAKARDYSNTTLIVSPNWQGSINQGTWHGHHQEKHWSVLSPKDVGGRCLFANSKMFMCAFENNGTKVLEERDICL